MMNPLECCYMFSYKCKFNCNAINTFVQNIKTLRSLLGGQNSPCDFWQTHFFAHPLLFVISLCNIYKPASPPPKKYNKFSLLQNYLSLTYFFDRKILPTLHFVLFSLRQCKIFLFRPQFPQSSLYKFPIILHELYTQ